MKSDIVWLIHAAEISASKVKSMITDEPWFAVLHKHGRLEVRQLATNFSVSDRLIANRLTGIFLVDP